MGVRFFSMGKKREDLYGYLWYAVNAEKTDKTWAGAV